MDSEGSLMGFGGGIWGSVVCLVLVLVGLWVRHCREGHEELRKNIQKVLEERAASTTTTKTLELRDGDLTELMGLLCGREFQLEYFAGINFAFYRTFVSPTIAGTYHGTGTIEAHALKRVEDTDLLMHAWIDFGVHAEEAKSSFAQLAKIHGLFQIRNEDFFFSPTLLPLGFVLCCFVVDIHKVIQLLGSRSFTQREKEANFLFWMQVGRNMNIRDLPSTLEGAERLVQDYVLDDRQSRVTEGGKALTEAITKLLVRQAQDLLFCFPESWVRSVVSVLLFEVGGVEFHRKLGFETTPSGLERLLVHSVVGLRKLLAWNLVPVPRTQRRLSEQLMRKNYGKSIHDPNAFSDIGPEELAMKLKT